MDWTGWHDGYDDPGSALSQRLRAVVGQIHEALDGAPAGPLRAISACSGQGHDLIAALATHPRGGDVRARLVELDPHNAAVAAERAAAAGLPGIEVVTADAALAEAYRDLVPAHLVLLCGVFGNVTDDDIERTVDTAPALCATGGTVIWTRARTAPDRFPLVCRWFEERGFTRHWVSPTDAPFGVGAHRYPGPPRPLPRDHRMFRFVSREALGR